MKNIILKYLLLAVSLFLIGCSSGKVSDNQTDINDSILLPDSEVRVATIELYDADRITAQIYADKILNYKPFDSMMAFTLDINILDSLKNTSTHIVGDSGIIKEGSGVVHIYGNVVVVTEDSTILETDYLWWDSNTNRIKTDSFVKITQEDDIITGFGLDADNKLNSFKILNQVSGKVSNAEKLENE